MQILCNRTPHRHFSVPANRWPSSVRIPPLSMGIVARALGILRGTSGANGGGKMYDAFTICDAQAPNSPEDWKSWLREGTYERETIPAAYAEAVQTLSYVKLAKMLREVAKE
ncbi:hypothetical protein FRC07_001567 [Ceratobasidium sp. 392]|nr:hypothetical protein FRC07_001567 [Ceratobasidium sp. 392]